MRVFDLIGASLEVPKIELNAYNATGKIRLIPIFDLRIDVFAKYLTSRLYFGKHGSDRIFPASGKGIRIKATLIENKNYQICVSCDQGSVNKIRRGYL